MKRAALNVSSQMKSVAAEERRIQQQIVAQQKKELTAFLENQKKEYRLCKDKIKEVMVTSSPVISYNEIFFMCFQVVQVIFTRFCCLLC